MSVQAEFTVFCPRCRRHYEAERTVCPRDGARLAEVPVTLPRPGNVFDSRYVILEVVGKGGMATIYRGYDVPNRRQCALKVLKVKFSSEERTVAQFFTEARLARRLEHPNIIRTYDYGRTDVGYLYIAMELLRGQTLSRLIRSGGALKVPRAMNLFSQIVEALGAAHGRGTIHRDLKPENIFVYEENGVERVKLLDFGIAQFAGTSSMSSREICGTPAYMSPEQIRGQPVAPPADLYSAGIVAFEMLVGRQPFTGPTPMDILKRQIKMKAPRISDVAPDVELSPELDSLVFQLMQKKAANRLAGAAQVRLVLSKLGYSPPPLPEIKENPEATVTTDESVPVLSYDQECPDVDLAAPDPGIVPAASELAEEVLVARVRPGILLEEGLSIRIDDAQPATTGGGDRESAPSFRVPTSATADRYSMLHVRFVSLKRTDGESSAEELRAEISDDLENWFGYVDQLGGLVCYDSGQDVKVLFGYLTESGEYPLAALEAARTLSIQVEHHAIRRGIPCGVRMGVATGVVYTDQNVEGPLDWLIKGSEIDFAVRLSRMAPVGSVVMCQNTALEAQPGAEVREMAPVVTRGGLSRGTFLLKRLTASVALSAPIGQSLPAAPFPARPELERTQKELRH